MQGSTFSNPVRGLRARIAQKRVSEVFTRTVRSQDGARGIRATAAGYWRKDCSTWFPVASPKFQRGIKAGSAEMEVTSAKLMDEKRKDGNAGQKLRVAVDVDEVLGRFVFALNNYIKEEHNMIHSVSDYEVYDFKTVWKCSQQESNELVHSFFDSPHFYEGIPPIPGADEALRRLTPYCDLVVVTSRQHVIQEPTLHWLDQHFSDTFSEVCFGNHFALEGTSRTKSEICRELRAEVLIDDNPGYAMECAEAGIQVLLFDWKLEYPWSKTEQGPTHENITRVSDWAAVEAVLATKIVYDGR